MCMLPVSILLMAASSSSGGPSGALVPAAERTLQGCARRVLVGRGTKSGMVRTLQSLQEAGILQTAESKRKHHKVLERAAKEHTLQMTPYGRVVQTTSTVDTNDWQYCNPFAYLYYLSTLNDPFGLIMLQLREPGEAVTVVLYVDELQPGNPWRPEKARQVQAVYCCIAE